MSKKKLKIHNDIITIQMVVDQLPTFKIDVNGDFVKWGKDNAYPKSILNSFNNHPEHAAIVKGKARYLTGTKICCIEDQTLVNQFLARANRFDDWYSLRKKCDNDFALFGGFAINVITNIMGTPVEWFHMEVGKLRIAPDHSGVWYSDNWDEKYSWLQNKTFFPFYKDGLVGSSIYFYKDYSPSITHLDGLYPVADYSSVLMDINTDIEISNFFNKLVQNGFSAGHIITFFSGELTPEVKKDIKERFGEQHQGTGNAGKVVLSFTDPEGKGAEVVNVNPNGLADQYESLNKRNQQKIITGHNVPGVLFKIKTEGALGDRNEIDLAHELFINEYAKVQQVPFNNFIKKMCFKKTGVSCDFDVEQVQPIGKELPLDNQIVVNALNARDPNIVTNYLIEKYGLQIPVAEISQQSPINQIQEGATNEHLKNLTPKQSANLDRIARKLNKKILTEQQAIMQLMPYGFSEADAKLYLGIANNALQVQQVKHEKFLEFIRLDTVEISDDYELIEEQPYNFQLKDKDEDYKKEDGNLVPKKGFLQGLIDTFRKKVNPDKFDTVIKTVYKYALRPELSAKGEPMFIETSRDFCYEMADLTSGKKRLTFEAIDKIHNDSDGDNTNAWDDRGGFWGNKKSCRHIWMAETYIEKIKK